jgi:adenylylsulfate kinase
VHDGGCVWITGRAGSGKSTVARLVAAELRRRGARVALVDDREVDAYLRRGDDGHSFDALAWLSGLLGNAGVTAVVAAALPGRDDRETMRSVTERFVEVYVDTPPELCRDRGAPDTPYEEPFAPDLRVVTHDREPASTASQVVSHLERVGLAPPERA